jgi:hypothetical protein
MNYLEIANQLAMSKFGKGYIDCVKFEKEYIVKSMTNIVK